MSEGAFALSAGLEFILVELPVPAAVRGRSRIVRTIPLSVGPLYPDPGALLPVALKAVLRTGDPAFDRVVSDSLQPYGL